MAIAGSNPVVGSDAIMFRVFVAADAWVTPITTLYGISKPVTIPIANIFFLLLTCVFLSILSPPA